MSAARPPITAVILAFNEQVHIGRCIERVKPLVDRIVVVDSFSSDSTVDVAKSLGAEVLQQPFVNHAAQFNWGVEAAAISSGWILRIDADEWLEPKAIAEIQRLLPTIDDEIAALSFRRKVIFQGRWIRWGGVYPTILTRLWRVGMARVEQRWMDEHVAVTGGRTMLVARGDLVDENLKDLADWTAKHNAYTTRQVVDFLSLDFPLGIDRWPQGELPAGARRRRFLRNSVYARAPIYLRSLLYFLYRYVLRLGFLDGRQGLVFHTLQGFWNLFLIDAKYDEARHFIARHGLDEYRRYLAERHGIALENE